MGKMMVLCSLGDEKIEWDSESEKSINTAEERFKKLLKSGHKAWRVGANGKAVGKPLKVFPPHAERLLMVPVAKVVGG